MYLIVPNALQTSQEILMEWGAHRLSGVTGTLLFLSFPQPIREVGRSIGHGAEDNDECGMMNDEWKLSEEIEKMRS
jgi:hypothetical protein